MSYLTLVPKHELVAARPDPYYRDSPNERHRDILRLFGELGDNARESGGVLFRLETSAGAAPYYLVRSAVRPVNLTDGARVRVEEEAPERGAVVSFRLAANAVRRSSDKKTRTLPLDEIEDWAVVRLASALDDIHILNINRDVVRGGGKRRAVQIDMIDGYARVKDQAHLEALLAQGVGRSKSYGAGMLTVKQLS